MRGFLALNLMKKSLIIAFALLLPMISNAQKKQYKRLVKDLNEMLAQAEEFGWMYESFKVAVPYSVNDGKLSVVMDVTTDGRQARHRYEAPLNDVADFAMDIYFVLSLKSESLIVYEWKGEEWI